MPLYIGGKRVEDLYVGGQRIERAYLGSTLVYQPDAGFLDEFNRTALGPNWSVQGAPVTVTPGRACTDSVAYMWWTRQYPEDNVRASVTVDDIVIVQVLTNVDAADVSSASSYMAASWAQDGSLITTAYRLGQEVYREEVTVKKPEPGDVLTLQRQGNTVRVMINGTFVAGGTPSLPLPEGEGHRHINVSFTGCITRFEATEVGRVTQPRQHVEAFPTPGTSTYTLPEWAAHMRVLRWGGGGGGGGGDGATGRTGDGGRAGDAHVTNVSVDPSSTWQITVGAGGAGGAKEKAGDAGEQTRIGAMIANGGAGGSGYSGNAGRRADDLILRNGATLPGGAGGSNNQDGTAPGGGGGAGTGGIFGGGNPGRKGGDGLVVLDIVDQAWIDAYGTGIVD